jgi:hypothetical protein
VISIFQVFHSIFSLWELAVGTWRVDVTAKTVKIYHSRSIVYWTTSLHILKSEISVFHESTLINHSVAFLVIFFFWWRDQTRLCLPWIVSQNKIKFRNWSNSISYDREVRNGALTCRYFLNANMLVSFPSRPALTNVFARCGKENLDGITSFSLLPVVHDLGL